MKSHDPQSEICPGPGIRLLAFLVVYAGLVWIPREEWPRFFFLIALTLVLVPSGKRAWRRAARMLLLALPAMTALGVIIAVFGTLGDAARGKVFSDLIVRTVVAVGAAALVWGGAGMREFLAGLQQLRAPGVVVSVVTLALQSMVRMGREARAVLDSLRSRGGSTMGRRRRVAMSAPLTRRFLLGVVESHFHMHAALLSRGYESGALRMIRPGFRPGEWWLMPVYVMAVMIVVMA